MSHCLVIPSEAKRSEGLLIRQKNMIRSLHFASLRSAPVGMTEVCTHMRLPWVEMTHERDRRSRAQVDGL